MTNDREPMRLRHYLAIAAGAPIAAALGAAAAFALFALFAALHV
jgi:hypothetical protein